MRVSAILAQELGVTAATAATAAATGEAEPADRLARVLARVMARMPRQAEAQARPRRWKVTLERDGEGRACGAVIEAEGE